MIDGHGAASRAAVESALLDFAAGRTEGPLEITYSDMHGLWGGFSAGLAGDGALTITSRERGGAPVVQRRQLPKAEVVAVARLLVALEAWEQRVPERMPVPDESRAFLTIRCGESAVSVWEGFNDLARLGRLARVRALLLGLAPDDD